MKMLEKKLQLIVKFYSGSKRYFMSSIGFDETVRYKVAIAYNFYRYVDNSIDDPKHELSIDEVYKQYKNELKNGSGGIPLIHDFVELSKEHNIDKLWVEALFKAVRSDGDFKEYETLDELLAYVYGVAEVVGLMMSKILNLDDESQHSAKMLGRSAQWANFLRDVEIDNEMNRMYFPREDLDKYKLENLSYEHVRDNEESFNNFMKLQIERFYQWVEEGEKGYKYIPKEYQKPIRFATDLDKWKIEKISKDPLVVYRKKVDPNIILMMSKYIRS